ncbi:LysR family transcriptional regulator [Leeia oryzae]|uniref:LysR family transcriptional regulator n=1 Tax=Leeia oryzae TaxID=356662 RepID=UPI0003637AE8|nr:LysR family transcriptional regulator [Leeia oryzae]
MAAMLRNLFDVDLKLLRVFCTIVEAGGFTAAQTVLNTGLPRLSTMIRDLEVRLGTTLCQRGRQGFQLTEEGLATYEAAKALFSDIDRFRNRVAVLSGRPTTHLSIGFVDGLYTLPGEPMAKALAALNEQLPDTHITLHVMRPDELERAVIEERLQIAIGAFHHHLSGLIYQPLFTELQDLYCSTEHPLGAMAGQNIPLEDVCKADYVERGYMLESHKPVLINFKRSATAFSMEAILMMLLSGKYIGYLPTHLTSRWVETGRLRPLNTDAFSYSSLFSCIFRPGQESNQAFNCAMSVFNQVAITRPDLTNPSH